MSQSVTDQQPVEVTTTFEEAEAVVAQIFGTPEGRRNPYPLYNRLRELAPVLPSEVFGTLVTRYDDCQAVMRDPRLVRGWATRLDRLRPGLAGAPGPPRRRQLDDHP